MARTREFDTDKTVAALARTFWAGGYEATGITELVEATGVGRQSLYGAFGSKKDMLLVALDSYLSDRVSQMIEPLDQGSLDAIVFVFRRFVMAFEKFPDTVRMGCMMVNTSTESIAAEPEIVERAADYRDRFRGAFRRALERALELGEIDGSVEARADILTLLMSGMFVSIRGGADKAEVAGFSEAVVDQVEAWRLGGGVTPPA